MTTVSQTVPSIPSDISDTIRTNFVGFASFTILVWDHVITFSDEVELIWKGNKGPIIYLFLFNRYFTPLGFIINLFAYLSPTWTFEVGMRQHPYSCTHFVRYEGVTVAIAVEVVGAMMLLRINALYPTRKWITALLGVLLAVETGINAWLISRGERPPAFTPAPWFLTLSSAASASAWYPLMYDSIVFALTVNRTLPSIRKKEAGFIVKKLLEDGLLYYSVIFSITFVLTFMIAGAPPGTKNICAQMEQLITVAMMSRITLSLKKAGRQGEIIPAPFLFDTRNPDLFSDTFIHSVGDALDDLPPQDLKSLKRPDRLILDHVRNPIQFAIPSPQPSQMSEPFGFPDSRLSSPLRQV
ncbi:hypothetical protein B0H16DRAFT_1739116 [Mycena metata]|uniref:DUF6533 domain-containing protein n=1 Tax=Mycena metata TaxID=1033252 RepID=A0AAD7HG25_9AGAR|nr:hypothetical protein B0H16DRAFT_1739116 [Mycena metata]